MQIESTPPQTKLHWIANFLHWCPTSSTLLEVAEKKLFAYLKKSHDLFYVSVPFKDQPEHNQNIRTLVVNSELKEKATPLVLLHGFASGIGLWILNLDKLSCDRSLYALDIPGFGRSSRPTFSKDALETENQFVESIEMWRQQVGLEKFILLGHSLGGFLASSYAIKYPDRIQHLILADPWGFPDNFAARNLEIPLWGKILKFILQPFNPLAVLRAAGPWGPQLIERIRPDIIRNYQIVVDEPSCVSSYIYHCNAQTPSGETAFKCMAAQFGCAKHPMINRISELKQDIPITFIFGEKSWVDPKSGFLVKEQRKESFVDVKIIEGVGHHVYADASGEFNNSVNNICKNSDLVTLISSSEVFGEQYVTMSQESEVSLYDKVNGDMPVTL